MTNPVRPIALTFLRRTIDDGVVRLVINRPQSGNALNWALLEQLRVAVDQAANAAEVRAIVIAATGKTFISGADVGWFSRCLVAGNLQRVVECIRASQEVFEAIAQCPKPIVAEVHGATLGGGVELALACHRIVATPRASFCFPETGLGIYPASGGTYRAPRRIGPALTKWLIYTGNVLSPTKAASIGLIDRVVPPAELAQAARAATFEQVTPPRRELDQETARVESLFATASLERLLSDDLPPSAGRLAARAWRTLRKQPHLPLEWAERLIDEALELSVAEGARHSLEGVPAVFRQPQVKVALEKVAQQQRQAGS